MTVHHASIEVKWQARVTFYDITAEVGARLEESGVVAGLAVVSSPTPPAGWSSKRNRTTPHTLASNT